MAARRSEQPQVAGSSPAPAIHAAAGAHTPSFPRKRESIGGATRETDYDRPVITKYTVGFCLDPSDIVVLLCKERPEWMAGLLNGVGGKIWDGESATDAMHREWGEETSIDDALDWTYFARQHGTGYNHDLYEVFYFIARVPRLPKFPARNDAGETFEFRKVKDVVGGHFPCAPNVPWLLGAAVLDPHNLFLDVTDNTVLG